jgi:hypothetical protein
MQKFTELKELVESAEVHATAFYHKGNSAAGTRLRNALMDIKKKADEVRKDVTEKKNNN